MGDSVDRVERIRPGTNGSARRKEERSDRALLPVGSVGKFYLESDHLLTMTPRLLIEVLTISMVYMEANYMTGG